MTAIKVAEDLIPKKNWNIRLIDCNRNLNNSLSETILGSEILGGRWSVRLGNYMGQNKEA